MAVDRTEFTAQHLTEYKEIILQELSNFNLTLQQRQDMIDDLPFVLYEKDKKFDKNKSSLRHFRKLICRHYIIDYLRVYTKRHFHESIGDNFGLLDKEFNTGYEDLVSILSEQEQEVVNGVLLFNYTFTEISKKINTTAHRTSDIYYNSLGKIKAYVTNID